MLNRVIAFRARAFSRALASGIFAFGVFACGLAASGAAFAQSQVCRQLEAELASLGQGSRAVAPRKANAERAQLARVQGSIASLDCNKPRFIFDSAPAQCSGLKAQASGLMGRINQIEGGQQASAGGDTRRRMQIMATLDSYNCRGGARREQATAAPEPQRQRSFFDVLFGRDRPEQPRYATAPMQDGGPPLVDGEPLNGKTDPNAKKYAGGGPLAICVRTCDGFFFPVNYEGTGADDQYEEMCQASCPASATEVYWMPGGADLDRAANEAGVNYSALPNAFKYRQAYDPACTCKTPGQSWAQTLRQADVLLGEGRNDITVTQETSNRMVLQSVAKGLRGVRDPKGLVQANAGPVITGSTPPEEKLNTNFATNSKETSGIGPRSAGARLVGQQEGEKREVQGKDGEKKTVRVVAPELAPMQ